MYEKLNKKYFGSTLPSCTITIQKDEKSFGSFSREKCWHNADNDLHYEINISASYLGRDKYSICSTLLHEMIHLFSIQNNLRDTSRQGRYHNKLFKKLCLERGLFVDLIDGSGWAGTTATDNLKEFINSTKIEFYDVYYLQIDKPVKRVNQSKKFFKYICPKCLTEIKSVKNDLNVVCSDCNKQFEKSF